MIRGSLSASILARGLRLFRRWLPFCAALALFANFCPSASSQEASSTAGAKLLSVTQVGSQAYSTEQVTALSGLQNVATVNRDTIQAAADRLAHTRLFSRSEERRVGKVGGLRVTFELQDAPTFPVSFDNFPWFTDDELTAALNQAGLPFHGTAPAT